MRSILVQTVMWIAGPALATLFVISLCHTATHYSPVNNGHAFQAPAAACVTSPDEFFNDCAVLDASQVQDLRTEHGNTDLEVK